MGNLADKKILIGITGGIAAYKICELIRMFKRNGADVTVIPTENALNFVTKLTLQTLSQNNVYVNEFEIPDYKPEHIALSDSADIMVIAPATANTISKLANGICDNLLTSVACAFKKPVFIAPAMNTNMWDNPIIKENISKLKSLGYNIIEPESGFLACGTEGNGRLCELSKIYDAAEKELTQKKKLAGKKVLITSGGTIEEIDCVRYISNYSSGKMGYALANEAYESGAKVSLVTTKVVTDNRFNIINVKSAEDMLNAVKNNLEYQDIVFMAAAVADFKVKNQQTQKIKKSEKTDELTLTLVKNPDILKTICEIKKEKNLKTKIIGFCAESENLLNNAKEKISKKGCDYLIANDISRADIGFGSDDNEVTILYKNGTAETLEKASKSVIAKEIIGRITKDE
ncbi:bifunctional phosphopantothenoylcysteine decarboxylase/phosphopantothenate--cysteine ligase CoaBC [bacterium]|nr:bifunctional phosphopantothenoylcysteine decarboxylase/phosphopantothenate--cysteine ligase CoaBC [bacterium]